MIRTRKATARDLHRLALLFDNYRQFYGKSSDPDAAQIFLRSRISNSDSEIFIAEEEEGQVLGFVQLYPLSRPPG